MNSENSIVRLRKGVLQTPLHEYEHPRTSSRIGLVGMMHIGNQTYYDTVSEYIRTQEKQGAEVHYEMVKPLDEEEKINFPSVATLVEQFEALSVATDILARSMNAVKQKEALEYSPNWQNHDIGFLELVNLLGHDRLSDMIEGSKKIEKLEKKLPQKLTNTLARGAFRLLPLVEKIKNTTGEDNEKKKIIIDHRNNIALDAVSDSITANPDQHITMLWGAAHVPGISSRLEKMGYKMSSKQWLGALSLKNR